MGWKLVIRTLSLMWMAKDYRNINGRHPLSWKSASDWAGEMNTVKWGGYDDWRLPNIDELKDLYTHERKVHSFTGNNTLGYPSVVEDGAGYFLISSDSFDGELVWAFGYFSGTSSVIRKDTGYLFGSVRLVR